MLNSTYVIERKKMTNIITDENMSEWVTYVFNKCSIPDGDDTSSAQLKVEGLNRAFAFYPQELKKCRPIVAEIVAKLPTSFNSKQGDSILNVMKTKEGNVWTKDINICEYLIVLAIGLGLMEYTFESGMWKFLPNGIPLIRVCH